MGALFSSAAEPTDAEWEATARELLAAKVPGPCALDASPASAGGFAQGSLALVEADLAAVLAPEAVARALQACEEARWAFAFRRELCNLKKVRTLLSYAQDTYTRTRHLSALVVRR